LVSVGWVHVRDGKLLAVRSRGRDRFFLPGGKPEPEEDYRGALRREVREELGVALHDLEPAFTVRADAYALDPPTELTMHCFYARAVGEPQPSREIEELAWLTIPCDQRAAPAVTAVLNQLDGQRRGQ
jgi:8-oxo-dGTP pyrophosphatase MutT (NUDIX family)